jgi:hypothetical protein
MVEEPRERREGMMTTRIALMMTLLAASVVAASLVGSRPIGRPSPTVPSSSAAEESSPIESLDAIIQDRLHGHDGNGMMRLIHPVLHRDKFVPETPAERKCVEGLQASGWSVGLRLGARDSRSQEYPTQDRELTNPMAVTGEGIPDDSPGPDVLREVGRRALQESDGAGPGRASGSRGRWSIEARVVRADRQACVGCHSRSSGRDLKVGDALGVAIYYYAGQRP